MSTPENNTTHFGFRDVPWSEKARHVRAVFDSVAPKYDRIFVLNEGHLVEQGSHAELLKLGGVYADLWNNQQDSSNEQHSSG